MKKILFLLFLMSASANQAMDYIFGQEIPDDIQMSDAIDKKGNVLVEEYEIVAVKRKIDKKYRFGQVRLAPSAAAQFIGLASFNPDLTSAYQSFAVDFKTNVRRLPAALLKN